MDHTDIDLNSGMVAFGLDEPRTLNPREIVERGIAGTVTVDRMVLATRGVPVEAEEGWSLRVWRSGQMIPLSEPPPEELRGLEGDAPVRIELRGWREGERVSGRILDSP